MKRLLFSVPIVLSLLTACSAPHRENSTTENDSTKPVAALSRMSVRFPIPIVEAGQTPFYVAIDNNYYKDEGLDVKFGMGSKELNPVKMIATGEDDLAVLGGPDGVLVARSKEQPIKAVAVLHRNSNFPCLVTLKSSGITKPEQLRNKKVGFFYGHISTDVIRNLFHKTNVKVEEVDVGFDYSQLISGNISAEWAFTVTAGLELPAKGVDINFISPADYGIITHGYTLFASEEKLESDPDLIRRFLKATMKGVKFTVENPEMALESLIKRDPNLDKELSLKRLKAYNAVTSNSKEFPPGFMDQKMFQETYDRLVEEKIIEKPFDVKDVFTTEFIELISKDL